MDGTAKIVPAAGSAATSPTAEWVAAAQAGCVESLGKLLGQFRNYLLLVARHELGDDLRSKVGPSDIVQETLIKAQKDLPKFRGNSDAELRGWLRQILLHQTLAAARTFRDAKKRTICRELPLQHWLGENHVPHELIDSRPTPRTEAVTEESRQQVRAALMRIPEHLRHVVQLRTFDRQSWEGVAEQMDCSPEAARKLFSRALVALSRTREIRNAGSRS